MLFTLSIALNKTIICKARKMIEIACLHPNPVTTCCHVFFFAWYDCKHAPICSYTLKERENRDTDERTNV